MFLQPANLKSAETRTHLAGLKPDAIVVAAFGQILPQSVLEIPPLGCINIHPSLLPEVSRSGAGTGSDPQW